jgi:quercetin dioxygenase-like cupin family protein
MLWFFDTLVSFPVRHADGEDGVSVMESRAARGDSPPLHIHHTEDETFHVLDGELVIRAGDAAVRLGAGSTLLAPKGVPHSYLVVSEQALWLVITSRGAFERFVDAASRPAETDTLPPRSGPPGPEELQAVAELARRHEIELVGPPLCETELRTAA